MPKKTIDQIDVRDRRVLMRVDFNVPLDAGRISDDRRITQALPSIRSVLDRGGRLVLMSHLGRPAGKGPEPEFSLEPVRRRLSELIGPVDLTGSCVGSEAEAKAAALAPGRALLLENLRFFAEETLIDKAKKNPDGRLTAEQAARVAEFARSLARLGEVYCNDAFGTCHRKHASMYDVPLLMPPGRRTCGFLVRKELQYLGDALARPKRPFVAILGGAKVSDKIAVIEHLLPKVDHLLVGGAMAYTFLAAQGHEIGASRCEPDRFDTARSLLAAGSNKLRLPVDSVCAERIASGAPTRTVGETIPAGWMGLDIGPQTVAAFCEVVRAAGTIVWNGPMGVFETPPFEAGTLAVARAVAEATGRGAVSVIGGGDSAAAVERAGLAERMTHISTGGGASLEFLEGRPFETIELLDDA